jgi:hypothetical protein
MENPGAAFFFFILYPLRLDGVRDYPKWNVPCLRAEQNTILNTLDFIQPYNPIREDCFYRQFWIEATPFKKNALSGNFAVDPDHDFARLDRRSR